MLTLFRGANKEIEDEDCNTPLLTAIAHGQQEALSKLISLGCATDVRGSNGRSAVFIAADKDRSEVLEVFKVYIMLEISKHSYVLFPPYSIYSIPHYSPSSGILLTHLGILHYMLPVLMETLHVLR